MLEDGKYVVWVRTALAQGTGIVMLTKGRITGEDTVIAYSGSYEQDGDHFTATVRTRRYGEGQPSVFGVDEVELQLEGRSAGQMVVCKGTAAQAPGLVFEATLIRSREQAPAIVASQPSPTPAVRITALPKFRGTR
jgi:hypothetical protein